MGYGQINMALGNIHEDILGISGAKLKSIDGSDDACGVGKDLGHFF